MLDHDVMSVSLSIFITTDDAQQSSTPSEKARPEGKDLSSKWFTCLTINIVNSIGPPTALEAKAEQPQDPSSSVQGSQDHSLLEQPLEQPQGPSSLEYNTLREMLADLVDLLAGNAPVITQLNNHLFSSRLIPKAVYIDAQNSSLSPFERANKMINAVLATLESHPNPKSAFTSLITAICKVGLTNIATKLTECFSKCMHH